MRASPESERTDKEITVAELPRTLEVKDYRNKLARRRRLSNLLLRSINK